jgi:5-methylcytosine-specific restriction endonuclease McrA
MQEAPYRPTKIDIENSYRELRSYAAVARLFGISRQRVHQLAKDYKNTGRLKRKEKYKSLPKKCPICKSFKTEVLHHIDGNNSNDTTENLLGLCKKCHVEVHKVIRLKKKLPLLIEHHYKKHKYKFEEPIGFKTFKKYLP